MIQVREYDGTIINEIPYIAWANFIYETREKAFKDEKRPPDMTAAEMMTYIMEKHLEKEFLKTMNALIDRFGVVGAALGMKTTILIYFDMEG